MDKLLSVPASRQVSGALSVHLLGSLMLGALDLNWVWPPPPAPHPPAEK
jgi:hypothetical protein